MDISKKPIAKEFSRNAYSYDTYNIIQKEVAKKVISFVDKRAKNILDLGCGRGEIYKLIDWNIDYFIGVDLSETMCDLHPKDKNVCIINEDYESSDLYEKLKKNRFDIVISSSSLQWCNDLERVVKNISNLSNKCAISIFCDGTFKTIYKMASIDTFLPKYSDVVDIFKRYFNIKYKREFYRLYFEDNISKFRYIKKSGVSGGKKQLGYKETKKLIDEYPLDYLEFEVLYLYV